MQYQSVTKIYITAYEKDGTFRQTKEWSLQTLFHISKKAASDTIIASIQNEQKLYRLSPDGTKSEFYKGADLSSPGSIAVDKRGNFYVCGEKSANVHQVSHDGCRLRILLDSSNGLKEPSAIVFQPNGWRFFVADAGDGNQNTIHVYKLQ